MSKSTTGRRLLDDLDKRVVSLETARRAADPMAAIKAELEEATKDLAKRIKSIDRRLSDLEAKEPETPPSDPPTVAKATKRAAK